MNITIKIIAFFMTFFVAGCATNGAKYKESPEINLSQSEIIIFRKNKFVGSGSCQRVKIDNKEIGILQNGGFIKIIVDPGEHSISLKRKASTNSGLITEGGKTYYLEYLTASGGIIPIPIGPVVTVVSTYKFRIDLVTKDYAMQYLPELSDSNPPRGCMSKE